MILKNLNNKKYLIFYKLYILQFEISEFEFLADNKNKFDILFKLKKKN
jgi:hypothetical protein